MALIFVELEIQLSDNFLTSNVLDCSGINQKTKMKFYHFHIKTIAISLVIISACTQSNTLRNNNIEIVEEEIFKVILMDIIEDDKPFKFVDNNEIVVDPKGFITDSILSKKKKKHIITNRIKILEELNIQLVEYLDYDKCTFWPEMMPPDDDDKPFTLSKECEKWVNKVAVIISLPEKQKHDHQIYSVRLIANTNYSVERYIYFLEKSKEKWKILEKKLDGFIAS